ncbi:MAG TPA: MBL fold metallo-hydrolase [Vicinamibacteria bacterium]
MSHSAPPSVRRLAARPRPAATRALVLALLLASTVRTGWAEVRLEYVAHSCFVVVSPGGARALVDPYNGTRWLGYSFPAPMAADVVLVSHPHYDHDASYYAGDAPVLRRPGEYAFGDLRIQGVEGHHASPWGDEFGRTNTLWLVEAGGVRIAHLGDTGPLGPAALRALGRVDVLILPVDDLEHILKGAEVAAIREVLRPAITVPVHYRLAGLTSLPKDLGPVDAWLAGQRNVVRLPGHEARLDRARMPAEPQVLVFTPSPAVKPWPPALREAWEHRHRARAEAATPEGRALAIAELRQAVTLAPECMVFAVELGRLLSDAGRDDEALATLEKALAGAGSDDREYTARARDLLAGVYVRRGESARAAQQYRLVLQNEERRELRARAESFLAVRPGGLP